MDIILTLSNELNIKKEQVIQTVKLIDQGIRCPLSHVTGKRSPGSGRCSVEEVV